MGVYENPSQPTPTRHPEKHAQGSTRPPVHFNMATIHLSTNETVNYSSARAELIGYAKRRAWIMGRRFAQIVADDGRILDVLEIDPHAANALR